MKILKLLFALFLVAPFMQTAMAQDKFPMKETISFRSVNYPDKFIRHRGFLADLTNISSELDKKDASFKVVPALNGKSGYVSFESVNYPGHFLRHQGFRLKLQKQEGAQLYKDDTSFKPVKGLDGAGYSFESANYPDHYLRHQGFQLKLHKKEGSSLYKKDASFLLDAGFTDIDKDKFYRLKTMFRGEGECLEGNAANGQAKGGSAFMDKVSNVSGQMWKLELLPNGYYRLKTMFRGEGECLEGNAANGQAKNGTAFMDKVANVSGQMWRLAPIGNGHYRLKTLFRGEGECLEGNAANGQAKGGAAFMDKVANVSGQMWKLEPAK